MGFVFLLLFCALVLASFKYHQVALALTIGTLFLVSISALFIYMSLPLGVE
jgi:hypothetical protein